MNLFFSRARAFLRSEDGPTATEYAVMLALIVFICIGTIASIGSTTEAIFAGLDQELSTSTP
jgi:pilus assembly protein Flp/PilA